MKELEKKFEGKGEVKGYVFEQIDKTSNAYIYRIFNHEFNTLYFEVFKRKENTRFDVVSYPNSNSFGIWAWTYNDQIRAYEKFNEIK